MQENIEVFAIIKSAMPDNLAFAEGLNVKDRPVLIAETVFLQST